MAPVSIKKFTGVPATSQRQVKMAIAAFRNANARVLERCRTLWRDVAAYIFPHTVNDDDSDKDECPNAKLLHEAT